jgi:hypothetical protein
MIKIRRRGRNKEERKGKERKKRKVRETVSDKEGNNRERQRRTSKSMKK